MVDNWIPSISVLMRSKASSNRIVVTPTVQIKNTTLYPPK